MVCHNCCRLSLSVAAGVIAFAALSISSLILGQVTERYVAIDNVCAWPNLTLLPDGSLIASIHNEPSHGKHEGDVECWVSSDGGRFWKLRGVPAPHEPGTVRMNVAAGLAHDGALIVLSTGWGGPRLRGEVLSVWVCRSQDGGKTWKHSVSVTLPSGIKSVLVPYGDIQRLAGQTLAACFYHMDMKPNDPTPTSKRHGSSYLLFSHDDGLTWGGAVIIAPDAYNETAILRVRPDRWLAAARTNRDAHLDLFTSENEGQSWVKAGPLTLPSQHPGHLLRVADGRILLSYGVREQNHQGIAVRVSADDGNTWNAPTWIVHMEGTTDGGYPSTVQLPDGTLVTAYYSNGIPEHQRYHMGVVRWSADHLKPLP